MNNSFKWYYLKYKWTFQQPNTRLSKGWSDSYLLEGLWKYHRRIALRTYMGSRRAGGGVWWWCGGYRVGVGCELTLATYLPLKRGTYATLATPRQLFYKSFATSLVSFHLLFIRKRSIIIFWKRHSKVTRKTNFRILTKQMMCNIGF